MCRILISLIAPGDPGVLEGGGGAESDLREIKVCRALLSALRSRSIIIIITIVTVALKAASGGPTRVPSVSVIQNGDDGDWMSGDF